MGQIDIHNYEAYLLDFSEGNLTDDLQMELELLLIQHPELDVNLSDLTLISLEEEIVPFANKTNLKKTDADLISENKFIAYVENQLHKNERLELEKSCAINPSLSKEFVLYTNTISVPDYSIIFENKQLLKRKPKVIWFNFSAVKYAAAACVLFLIGLFILWPQTNTNPETSTLAIKTNIANSGAVSPNNKNIHTESTTPNLIVPKATNNSHTQSMSIAKKEQSLLANTSYVKKNTISVLQDTTPVINISPIVDSPKNETLIALNAAPIIKPKTVVQIITENDDEMITVNKDKRKKGIWAAASKALKNLNHAGVKSVNGDEKEASSYALTLGDLSITHKAGL